MGGIEQASHRLLAAFRGLGMPGSAGRRRIPIFLCMLPVVVQAMSMGMEMLRWVPVWAWYADPGYAYLLSGGQIMLGETPFHNDHPGTSLQWIIGIVEMLAYKASGSPQGLAVDLLTRTEFYALAVSLVLGALYVACLAFAAYQVYRAWGLWSSLSFQLALLWSLPVLSSGRYLLWPESLVIDCSLVVAGLLISYSSGRTTNSLKVHAVALGAVAAVGLTAKIIFLPMVIVATIVLAGRQLRIFFAGLAVGTVLVLVPVYERIPYMWNWFMGIAFEPSRHGGSTQAPYNISDSLKVSAFILGGTVRWLWIVAAALVISVVFLSFVNRRIQLKSISRLGPAVLAGVSVCLVAGIKDGQTRDFVVLPICIAMLFALVTANLNSALGGKRLGLTICGLLAGQCFLAAHGLVGSARQYEAAHDRAVARMHNASLIEAAPLGETVALAYNVWTPMSAIAFSLPYVPGVLVDEFYGRDNRYLFYSPWGPNIDWPRTRDSGGEITCRDFASRVVSGGVTIVVESPEQVSLDESGERLILRGLTAAFQQSQVGDYSAYRLLDVRCLDR